MKTMSVTWTGIRPLIVHNGQLADPLNLHSRRLKSVTSKKKKSDTDYEDMARIEFEGGLYWDEKAGPIIPIPALDAVILSGARKTKIGKDVQAAVFVADDVVPIQYDGPRTVEGLWKKRETFVLRNLCKVGAGTKVMRTRPMFPTGWKLSFTLEYDDSIVNENDLMRAMVDAGALCGLCEWRPRFGRFLVERTEGK